MANARRAASGLAIRGISLLMLVLLWEVVAVLGESKTLPLPQSVLFFVVQETLRGDLLANFGVTLWRVIASYLVAMTSGAAIGIVLGRWRRADAALDTWVLVLLNMPALVIAMLCYIWLGLTETAAITAVALNKIPSVVITVREGARSLDSDLEEMRRVYRLSFGTWLRHILLPQLAPYLAAASRSGLAIVWKIVLVVELLGRSDGVGYAIAIHFQVFDVRGVLGYALAFTVLMLAIEFLLLQPLENHARRWRLAPA